MGYSKVKTIDKTKVPCPSHKLEYVLGISLNSVERICHTCGLWESANLKWKRVKYKPVFHHPNGE